MVEDMVIDEAAEATVIGIETMDTTTVAAMVEATVVAVTEMLNHLWVSKVER